MLIKQEAMERIYSLLKTPYKYGAVMKFDTEWCDSPSVFRWGDAWYMLFIKIDKQTQDSGYETHLAKSNDLLNWEYMFPILLRKDDNSWDSKQIAGYAVFVENELNGNFALQKVNGNYQFAYLGGCLNGYETDPLLMGQGTVTDICDPRTYRRQEKPILSPLDKDVREGENLTLYKAYMFKDDAQTLGYPYVNVYNAKGPNQKESIFLAVSNDGEKWMRYGDKAIIYDDSEKQNIRINGDPQILKIDDIYVMVYFILQDGKAFNTFACSYDLVHWTKWDGAPLIESEYKWENLYAHKPWIVVDKGVVYHYYCACNKDGERFIALATSRA